MPIDAHNVCLTRLIEAMDLNLPHNEIAWNKDNIQELLDFSPPDSLSVKHEPATGDYEINLNFSITEVDKVLAYRPKPKSKAAKKRKRKARKWATV